MLQLKSRCDGAYGIGLRQDYRRYGGAALPGVRRVCIICLRVGSGFVVVNAVKAARRFVYQDFNLAIIARLS
jgi:fatty acid/phospholipid biosynthesis enzyme